MTPEEFKSKRMTSDFVWEDPLQRYEGAEDSTLFFGLGKYFAEVSSKRHNEIHSSHEIIMDWEFKVIFTNFQSKGGIFFITDSFICPSHE